MDLVVLCCLLKQAVQLKCKVLVITGAGNELAGSIELCWRSSCEQWMVCCGSEVVQLELFVIAAGAVLNA